MLFTDRVAQRKKAVEKGRKRVYVDDSDGEAEWEDPTETRAPLAAENAGVRRKPPPPPPPPKPEPVRAPPQPAACPPPPLAPVSAEAPPVGDPYMWRMRIQQIYIHHNPEKLKNGDFDKIVQHYQDAGMESLYYKVVDKYGLVATEWL